MRMGTADRARSRRQTSMPCMPGQQHVEEHDVRVGARSKSAQALGPVGGQDHVEPLAAEAGGQGLAVGLLVLDDQDLDAVGRSTITGGLLHRRHGTEAR